MGELTERAHIAAPSEVIYDLVDDPARFVEWQPYVMAVAELAGRPEGIGSSFTATYRVFGRRIATRWVITAAEHGRLLETTGTTSGGWAHWRFTLEAAGDATLLLTTLDYHLPGPIFSGPIALVAQFVLGRRLRETIRNLGRLAERDAGGRHAGERHVGDRHARTADAAPAEDSAPAVGEPPTDARLPSGASEPEARGVGPRRAARPGPAGLADAPRALGPGHEDRELLGQPARMAGRRARRT